MPIDTAHLLEKDGLPDFIPKRRGRMPLGPMLDGSRGVSTFEDIDEENAMVSRRQAAERAMAVPVVAGVDPFRHMDFRVSWTDGVASINRGRVYSTFWSQPDYAFAPRSFIIQADEIPLVLTAEQEGEVWLSLPVTDYGDTSFLSTGSSLPFPEPPLRFQDPDGFITYAHTFWSGFDFTEYARREALASEANKFAYGGIIGTAFDLTDMHIQLAYVGPNFAVRHLHFGSVFMPAGFDHLINTSP